MNETHQAWIRLRSVNGQWLVHPDLRGRLIDEAADLGTNVSDVTLRILSGRYKVAYEPGGRRTRPALEEEVLNVRVPGKLWDAVRRAAWRNGRRDLDEVRFALCDHYGLALP